MILLRGISMISRPDVSHQTRPNPCTGPRRVCCGCTCQRRRTARQGTSLGPPLSPPPYPIHTQTLAHNPKHLARLEERARGQRGPDAEVDERLNARGGIRVVAQAVLLLHDGEAGVEALLDFLVRPVPEFACAVRVMRPGLGSGNRAGVGGPERVKAGKRALGDDVHPRGAVGDSRKPAGGTWNLTQADPSPFPTPSSPGPAMIPLPPSPLPPPT